MESRKFTVNHLPNDSRSSLCTSLWVHTDVCSRHQFFSPSDKNNDSIPRFYPKGLSLRNPHPCSPTGALPKASFWSHLSPGLGLLSSLDNGAREKGFLGCEFFYHWKKLRTKLTVIMLFCKNLKLFFLQYKTTIKLAGIN